MPGWPIGLYRVAGQSMLPTYRPGDTLVGWRWFTPRPGQVVVAEQAGRPIIKRVEAVSGRQITLRGDNPNHSTDSRDFGPIPNNRLIALIIAKL